MLQFWKCKGEIFDDLFINPLKLQHENLRACGAMLVFQEISSRLDFQTLNITESAFEGIITLDVLLMLPTLKMRDEVLKNETGRADTSVVERWLEGIFSTSM